MTPKTGRQIALSFAGSSVLAKQIDASGGADLFISADQRLDGLSAEARTTHRRQPREPCSATSWC